MKNLIFILSVSIFPLKMFSQCNTQTTHRPDGVTMEYFQPKPVIRETSYEVGTAIYKNRTTGDLTLNLSILFKSKSPAKLTGNAIIQTSSNEGIELRPVVSELMKMNGRDVALGLYSITERDYDVMKNNKLKSIFFYLEDELTGATVTENNYILSNQLKCFESPIEKKTNCQRLRTSKN
ncbi:hypothetical protein [Mesonia sp.]|uniref:hypothetical protein n=1 Tax=Mesonia sp. TaxID=1960830 RepID=UPI003F9D5E8C